MFINHITYYIGRENMPSVTLYIKKELYRKLQAAGDNESATVQQALEEYFKKVKK